MAAWLHLGNPIRIFCAWPIWAEATHNLGDNTLISSLSIDRQWNIWLTAWPKLGIHANKEIKVTKHTGRYFTVVKVSSVPYQEFGGPSHWQLEMGKWQNIISLCPDYISNISVHSLLYCSILNALNLFGETWKIFGFLDHFLTLRSYFKSFLMEDKTHYITNATTQLLMPWQHKEPGHQ